MMHIRQCMLGPVMAGVLALPASLVHAQAAIDFSKTEIRANKITDRFYTLEGQGGTIGVLLGADGVFMVDAQFAPLSTRVTAAIKQLTPLPVRYVVNTHVHEDHTGGNENFGKMGVTIIAREELRYRLAHPDPLPDGQPAVATAPIGLPGITYGDHMTMYVNNEEVQLIAIPGAHTDGDTMVCFPGLDIIMTGDFYRSTMYPHIDRDNGGTLQGMLDGLGMVIGRAGPNTRIIPGHGPMVDRRAVITYRDVVLGVRDRVAALIAQGKGEDEVVATRITAEFDGLIYQPGTAAELSMRQDRFVRQVYAELKAAR